MHPLLVCALLLGFGACSDDGADGPASDTDSGTDATDVAEDPAQDAAEDAPTDADAAEDATDVAEEVDASDATTETDTIETDTEDATDSSDAEPDAVVIPDAIPGDPVAIDPDAETRDIGPEGPCGMPVELVGRGLRRSPYVQSVFTDSARIAWTDTVGAAGSVRYSIAGSGEWRTVDANVRRFEVALTRDTEPYNAYDATLLGLEPDSDVCYEVYVDGALLVARGSFHTAWTSRERPISIVAMGDSGNASAEQYAVGDQMMRVDPDIFLHLGDMAYGDGTYPEFEERVFAVYEALMGSVPSWPTPGNHEYNTNFAAPYIGVYYLPEQAWRDADQEYYYSFDYGNVHFISMDSNEYRYVTTIGNTGDDMLDWLEDDLSRTEADWIIVFMHHPIYSSGSHGQTPWLFQVITPILEAHGVDLVLAGHDHHYERTYPIWDDAVAIDDDRALTYIVAGAGGAGVRAASGDWYTEAVNDQKNNFLHLVIDGCEAVGRAIDLDGELVDSFTLQGCD